MIPVLYQDRYLQWGIILVFAVLATIYSVVTPVFEASDEIYHYPVIDHLTSSGELPIQRPGTATLWQQEGSQPPLYYVLGAILTNWIDSSDLEKVLWHNPHAKLGIPLDPDNKNLIIHTEAEDFPWRGTVLAVHLIRLFSVLLGAISVGLTYLIAKEAVPENRWAPLLAASLTAFNPMFLFITGSVNNDNLTVTLSSLVILACLRIVSRGITLRRAVFLSVGCALATITKISGLTLLPIIGLSLLFHAQKRKDWRTAIYTGLGLLGAWIILASWWYLRNFILYHELLGLGTHVAVAGGRQIDLLPLLQREWYGFWVSYWALFGAVDILADRWIYWIYTDLTYLALGGTAIWVAIHIRARKIATLILPSILSVQIFVVLIGVIRWTLTTYASQGRLMFPAIAALSTITAIGLTQLTPNRITGFTATTVAASLTIIAGLCPLLYIAPTYALPQVVTIAPSDSTPIGADFQGLDLVAIKMNPVIVEEGERIPVTLYWRANHPLSENYSIYLHALGRNEELIGKLDSMPGAGSLPTTRMPPGQIIEDEYSLELFSEFQSPTVVRIQIGVGLLHRNSYDVINPVLKNGEQPTSISMDGGVAYPVNGNPGCKLDSLDGVLANATIGEFTSLWLPANSWAAAPGDAVPIALVWDRLSSTSTNWTVFVHLVNSEGAVIAQADAPPMNGFYPTSAWQRPCQIIDQHTLVIPESTIPGTYSVFVGLYDPSDPAYPRAVATGADGVILKDYAIRAGTLKVINR